MHLVGCFIGRKRYFLPVTDVCFSILRYSFLQPISVENFDVNLDQYSQLAMNCEAVKLSHYNEMQMNTFHKRKRRFGS